MTIERTTNFTLDTITAHLCAPFAITDLHVKPGAVSRDETSALALAYADWRVYAERLDTVVGSATWSIQLVPWGERRVIARLTILGITKDATGEGEANDPNASTVAEAQAKKRACAEFGLGRYLYHLPRIWGKGSGTRKDFRFDTGEPQRCLYDMYRHVGLSAVLPAQRLPDPPQITPAKTSLPPERLATARKVLADAEAATRRGANPSSRANGTPASDAQLGLIARLVLTMQQADEGTTEAIDSIGDAAGVAHLSSRTRREAVRTAAVTKTGASALINQLQKLADDVAHATA